MNGILVNEQLKINKKILHHLQDVIFAPQFWGSKSLNHLLNQFVTKMLSHFYS